MSGFQKNENTSEKASALMLAITILGLIIGLGLTVSTVLITEININKDLGDSLAAVYAADTGIELVLYDIRINGNIPAEGFSGTLTSTSVFLDSYNNSSSVVVSVPVGGSTPTAIKLNSVGNYKSTYRAFEVTQPK